MLAEAAPPRAGALRLAAGKAVADGVPVPMTARELEVLEALVTRAGHVVQRAALYRVVWGGDMPYRDRSVDVLVKRIRRKLAEAAPNVAYVHTHYGVGYRFAPQLRHDPSPDAPQGGHVE